jgi:DNA-binding HxlR family transcriptional regulator
MTIPPAHDDMPLVELSDPARMLLGQIADKWSIVIMAQLCRGPMRVNALKRSVSGITQKALTQALRRLERNGLVERRILPGSPPAVEYRGTELGFSLAPPMRSLFAWAVDRLPDVERAQARYDQGGEDR